MATRAVIRFADREEGIPFDKMPNKQFGVQIYKHYDGYPQYLGREIAEFLKDRQYVNGLTSRVVKQMNGPGDLMAQLTAHLKEDSGGDVYLYPAENTHNDHGQAYTYYIWACHDKPGNWISIFDRDYCVFVGTPEKLQNRYEELEIINT